jgi:CheY-like chemotaxis protein
MQEANVGILVVDDDPVTCKLLYFLLDSEGYDVWTAQTPEAALRVSEQEAVDLIILDVLMPRIDGFELLKRLRNTGSECPVMFLSANPIAFCHMSFDPE